MKNIWSVVCSKAVVDQMTNSMSLHDVVDEMTISFVNPEDMKKPTKNVPLSLAVVNLWYDENNSEERLVDYVIEIYDPLGAQTGEFNISAKFEKGKRRLRTIANINGLKLTDEGSYNIRTSYKDKKGNMLQVAAVPIDVKFILNMRRDDTNINPNANQVV